MDDASRAVTRSHKSFYTSVVLQVEDQLYMFPREILINASTVFRTIFMLPQGPNSPEGTSDANLITLPCVRKDDFEHLLDFLAGRLCWADRQDYTFAVLVSILKLSHMFDIPDGFSFAVGRLRVHPQASPVLLLQLACQFGVPQYIVPALRELMYLEPNQMTPQDFTILGPRMLWTVNLVKRRLATARQSLVGDAGLYLFFGSCDNRSFCAQAWEDAWVNVAVPMLLEGSLVRECRAIDRAAQSVAGKICARCLATAKAKAGDAVRCLDRSHLDEELRVLVDFLGFTAHEVFGVDE